MCSRLFLLLFFTLLLLTAADSPRFEDYPAATDWHGPAPPVKLVTRSEEMFQTRLTEGAKEPANFAGHYRFTFWGCGASCSASAIIDLETGDVYAPPLAEKGEGWQH